MIKKKKKKGKKREVIPFSQLVEKIAVVWTRVSTQEQELNGLSLETQRQACEE